MLVNVTAGDITLVCQNGACPAQLGQPDSSQETSLTYPDNGSTASKSVNTKLLIILLAAVVAPAGIALCATGIAAAVIYKRRKRKREEEDGESQAKAGKVTRLHKHHDGAVAGRQWQESLEGSQARQRPRTIWKSTDGAGIANPVGLSAGNPWIASAGPAELERLSNAGSSSHSSRQNSPEENKWFSEHRDAEGNAVQQLRPGETGFGSMPGGFGAMVTLPPARDSVYGGQLAGLEHPVPGAAAGHAGPAGIWQAARRSLAGSVAGIASALAHPFSR